jgi:hypothetical protein
VSRQPGGAPPPPPPVPPDQPPRSPWEVSQPQPTGGGPTEPPRNQALVAGLAVALAVSLAVSTILALRVKDESDQQARLRDRVAALQDEADALRRQQPQKGQTILGRIAAAVEVIRELKFKRVVKSDLVTDEQLAALVEAQYRKDSPKAEVDQSDAVLTALGLLGPKDDLWSITLGVVREQVAGYYDFDKKSLVVGGEATNPSPLDEVLLAHEYVHAVTDQYYDLKRLDKLQNDRKDDEATALLSLVEGDATVMMFEYAAKYLTPSQRNDAQSEAAAAPSKHLDAAPKSLRDALLFPYEQGAQFVRSLIANGGIAALNKAYENPPTSTEQILHISKFLGTRDEPTPVSVPSIASTMGAGWKSIESGGVGELDVRLIIDQFLPTADAERAASGWDGGRYTAARSEKGTVVAAMTVWDSETQAREATEILSKWLPARYKGEGSNVQLDGVTGRGWDSPDGAGAVIRNGSRVLLVVGPDRASVDRARSAFPGF